MAELRSLSLGGLFAKLRDALIALTRDLDKFIDESNRVISKDDIEELRNHIQERLNRNEEIDDNKKLKELLDLFATDQAVIEWIREDANSWIAMLDSIIENLSKRKEPLTDEERKELEDLIGIASQIKGLLRGGENKNLDHDMHG
ncbi:MAG: hypothetical protein ACP5RK_02685 [Candidatus Micrarchaeia archaeon]